LLKIGFGARFENGSLRKPFSRNIPGAGGHCKNTSIKNWGMDMNYETCSLWGFLIIGGFN